MSQEVRTPFPEQKNGSANLPILIPPEESIWRKYSPNHEFPLSTLASVALHLFAAMLVFTLGAIVINWGSEPPAPALGQVQFPNPGGGGQLDGGANPETALDSEHSPARIDDPDVTSEWLPL